MDSYAPDKLQRIALSLMGVMVVMTFTFTNIQAILWQTSDWLVGAVLPSVVVQLTNDERSDLKAAPLRRSTTLDAAAKLKAEHMAKNQYFAHYAPDGTTPWYWFDQAGYQYAHAGENLAIHFSDSEEVVEAWMDSPAHRANIVSGKFTEIGVGTAKGRYQGSNTVYVVQLFGAPAAVAAAPSTPSTVVATNQPEPATAPESVVVEDEAPTVAAAEDDTEVVTETKIAVETAPSEPVESEVVVTPTEVATPSPEPAAETLKTTDDSGAIVVSGLSSPVLQSMISTSSGLAVASVVAEATKPVSFLALVTKPNTVMQVVYTLVALAVFLLLILSFVDEMRHAHPVQMAYSMSLLLMMGGLYWLHTSLTSGAIIV